ncbi:hypothetical protein H112_06889 [Trichophyton rubrum D6]|uniref:Rho-GAP domain-containing protein n=4 Tax=Trichophyton TaxID=5550 RepID=F2SGA9_TRIRC|nr:uncharacterized protein TERG_02232 [Trichophyton rubrum CBS 118892]EZF12092.1 hypothetical protein H100_06912 [Trichophyton rubrum MR850]EZF38913.1 hypothetical protein H102_06874 [Trichophyton rubrum CBS 100081]EZF49512.1 hypothetical protein H103_06897 [Trichophyton rubrum CBS 288.86]EZF60138.1 hypothetical protein H104_06851 [Trichophyton rubrum CBS 289.86]EZF70772.1 hypothetical protein H105_06914 [Trichophyton soudanense CBS 452.61]EZF81513.1 hypothetical protein H110_06893 [Trichophy
MTDLVDYSKFPDPLLPSGATLLYHAHIPFSAFLSTSQISRCIPKGRPNRSSVYISAIMARKSVQVSPSQLEKSSRETSHQSKTSPSQKLSPPSTFPKGSTIRPVTSISSNEPVREPENVTNKAEHPQTPAITAIPPYPPSPQQANKHTRDPSKSFFSNLKASKSAQKIHLSDASSGHSGEEKSSMSRASSRDRDKAGRGTATRTSPKPDSPKQTDKPNSDTSEDHQSPPPRSASLKPAEDSASTFNPPILPPSSSSAPPAPAAIHSLNPKKSKPRFGGLLARTRSIRADDGLQSPRSAGPKKRPSNGLLRLEETNTDTDPPLKTAPLQQERTFRDVMGSTSRNRSADRPATRDGSRTLSSSQNSGNSQQIQTNTKRERSHGSSMMSSVASSSLFSNIKSTSSGAADRIGKAGKGFFGKIARSGSSNEREVVQDDNYVCSVINLPLVEQTRRTRMVKSLRNSKDKTEFWMPALPWRCIDYLNFKGCEEEGLYRVPGSGKEVKHWQRRFDTELDINLFDEPDLYDINTIGSMFKAWLRCLPDEILPKATQAKIAAECPGATTAPQLLKDELSKLPPYNYYLLFTITCHLSLLHSYVDKNKMDYRNLCICFQPCLKIDGYCFNFLVCDWKNCWQGCWTEKEHLEIEAELDRQEREKQQQQNGHPSDSSAVAPSRTSGATGEERAISSSGSSQPPPQVQQSPQHSPQQSPRQSPRQQSRNSADCTDGARAIPPRQDSTRSVSPKKTAKEVARPSNHSRSTSQLPELGPPLSPIRFSTELTT